MVWERYKRLSWVSHDLPGFMLDINVVSHVVTFTKIDASTGEIVKTKTFDCAVDALNEGRLEVESASASQKESEAATSQGITSNTEASGAV